jgi:hypothetical protein
MKPLLSAMAVLLLLACSNAAGSNDVASMDRKLRGIESNGNAARPDQRPTVFTEAEVNAYLASDNIMLPDGVRSVKLAAAPGVITGVAKVDFDRIREGSGSSNPLLSVFSGLHEVIVVAHAHGVNHEGIVHVDLVSLDGVEVPRFVLELFVEKYLEPKYPEIGLDSRFPLPNKIDVATVGQHQLTVTQK